MPDEKRQLRRHEPPVIEVELMTRAGCHLCDEMKAVVEQVARGLDVRLVETDIDEDEVLAGTYGHDIPVLFVNGSKAFKHRVSAKQLRARLLREAPESRAGTKD